MKTLILNGSPRAHGDSMYIVEKLRERLSGDVTIINVYEEKFEPCIDCRYCWKHADCAVKDDLFKVYDLMDEVDNIILSSPIYFSELSGHLLSYLSRFQRYYADRVLNKESVFEMKNKRGALILTAGGDSHGIERPYETARIILKHVNTEIIGTIYSLHTNEIPAPLDESVEAQVIKLANILNEA